MYNSRQVDAKSPIPGIHIYVESGTCRGDADIIMKHIYSAMLRVAGFDGAADLCCIGDIGHIACAMISFVANNRNGFLKRAGITVYTQADRNRCPRLAGYALRSLLR